MIVAEHSGPDPHPLARANCLAGNPRPRLVYAPNFKYCLAEESLVFLHKYTANTNILDFFLKNVRPRILGRPTPLRSGNVGVKFQCDANFTIGLYGWRDGSRTHKQQIHSLPALPICILSTYYTFFLPKVGSCLSQFGHTQRRFSK